MSLQQFPENRYTCLARVGGVCQNTVPTVPKPYGIRILTVPDTVPALYQTVAERKEITNMNKGKYILRWFLLLDWLGLGLYAVLVESNQNWRLMFAGACFLLAANNAFDGGKG